MSVPARNDDRQVPAVRIAACVRLQSSLAKLKQATLAPPKVEPDGTEQGTKETPTRLVG